MFGLSAQTPFAAPARPPGDAVVRALAAAGTVSGAFAGGGCGFHRLGPAAAALAGPPPRPGPGSWVLAAVPESTEAGHRAHLRERCLTAAQRLMLALACDGLDSAWVDDPLPDADALRQAGLDLGAAEPVGLVWCADG